MNIDDIEAVWARLKRRPYWTTATVLIIVAIALASSFLSGYLTTAGDRAASPEPDPGPETSDLLIRRVIPLSSKDGAGVGYDLVIENGTRRDEIVSRAELAGEVVVTFMGAAAALERIAFTVELDVATTASADPDVRQLSAAVYDSDDQTWGRVAKGSLRYEMDTRGPDPHKSLRYEITLPLVARAPARDRTVLRLMFKKMRRQIESRETEGAVLGGVQSRTISRFNALRLEFDSGRSATVDLGEEFLTFITNRKE